MSENTKVLNARPFILKTALCLWILACGLWALLLFNASFWIPFMFSFPLSLFVLLLDGLGFMETPFEITAVLVVISAANALVQAWFVWRFATIKQRRMTQPEN
jgi:hypothetical protein